VDSPVGELTAADKAALIDAKRKLLELLSLRQKGAPERESAARWAGPRIIEIRDHSEILETVTRLDERRGAPTRTRA
jgi:hypothetical protein